MHILNLKELKKDRNLKRISISTVFFLFITVVTIFLFYKNSINMVFGFIIIFGSMFCLDFLLLKIFIPKIFRNYKQVILIHLIIYMMFLFSILVQTSNSISIYFLPIGAAAIILSILTNTIVASINILLIAIMGSIIGEFSFGVFIYFIISGFTGVYSSFEIRNRKDLNKCGLYLLGGNILAVLGINIYLNINIFQIGVDIIWASGNALISVVIASGMLPILEGIFSITTNLRLLEVGDFNHPLLKRLMLEAPGTYHHSLMVGNLAENACEKIGANSLLARVAAYYHDIGKLTNPQYFIENQLHSGDKHKNLNPSISALILKRHVKDGYNLGNGYKLDSVLKDIIEQHHGTTLIEYFYKKVLENSDGTKEVDEKEFRYPGPAPQTKEAGVLMLADSVEAACRALEEPTYSRISSLVRKVITNKFLDQQLNQCDITLANLEEVQKSFTNTLASIYHSRIEYPEDKEEISVEQKS